MKHAIAGGHRESSLPELASGGRALPASLRTFFEPRFGYDFSNVRLHTGSRSGEMAGSLNARAFTYGRHIVFGKGDYRPETAEGLRLIGHELTHVIQQDADSEVTVRRYPREVWQEMILERDRRRRAEELAAQCVPAAGLPPTTCGIYFANRSWLPDPYVNNATCACTMTPDEPKANCVRKFLQDRLVATPAPIKTAAARRKALSTTSWWESQRYQVYVQTELTPRIYRDHWDAYRSCCCPSGPADYPAWIGVTTVPMSCSDVWWSIRWFGSCNGVPGFW